MSLDLLAEAILFGILLGCFYAAVSIGLSVSFGLLDVPHVAHPAIMILGSYCTYVVASYGLDPILAGVILMPAFFVLGMLVYRFYYEAFERRGTDAGVRGIAFFFGLAFIVQVILSLVFGLDQRSVAASYIGSSLGLGEMRIPWRLIVALLVAVGLVLALNLYLSRTFQGRAMRAVAQDPWALKAIGAN